MKLDFGLRSWLWLVFRKRGDFCFILRRASIVQKHFVSGFEIASSVPGVILGLRRVYGRFFGAVEVPDLFCSARPFSGPFCK